MVEEYDNFLRCKSNPDFLTKIAPYEIMKNANAKFISFKNGEYYFQSINDKISKAVHQLAKKYPDEEFELKYWNAHPMMSEKTTICFKGDNLKIIEKEPIFHLEYSNFLVKTVGPDIFSDFLEKVNKYLQAIKPFFQNEEGGKWDEGISIQYDDIKLEAVLALESLINIRGYFKSASGSWELIDEKSYISRVSNKYDLIENDQDNNEIPINEHIRPTFGERCDEK